MSRFKAGDRVRIRNDAWLTGDFVVGEVGTVVGTWESGVDIRSLDGSRVGSYFDSELEPESDEYKAKYDALVADLIEAHGHEITRNQRYDQIVQTLLPKPKQYDVTVRCGPGEKDHLLNSWGSRQVRVVEVTE